VAPPQHFSGTLRRVLPPRREARVHTPGEVWLPAGSAEDAGAKMPVVLPIRFCIFPYSLTILLSSMKTISFSFMM